MSNDFEIKAEDIRVKVVGFLKNYIINRAALLAATAAATISADLIIFFRLFISS